MVFIVVFSVFIFLKIRPIITGEAVVSFSIVDAPRNDSGSVGGGGSKCIYDSNFDWNCSEWSECIEEIQTRKCKDVNNCGTTYGKPTEIRNCSLEIPEQLLDIKFELEENIIFSSGELVALISFESFGAEPTPVNLTYIILDKQGNEVYKEHDYIIVGVEEILIKSFKGLELDDGKYILILKTLYGDNIRDEFRQEFETSKKRKGITGRVVEFFAEEGKWYGVGAISVLIIILIWWMTKRIKKPNKNKQKTNVLL